MSIKGSVQLGSVTIELLSDSALPSPSTWSSLDPLKLQTIKDLASPASGPKVDLLSQAFRDPGLGLQAEWRDIGDGRTARIRCFITPSDVGGSIWKQVLWRGREAVIKGLLSSLTTDWEIENNGGRTILQLTDEDNHNMQDIYASVPSPTDPDFEPTESPVDQEIHRSLQNYENPEGVKAEMYLYQIRSVAKMLQMETQSKRLVDPLFTPLKEAGADRIYYVNMSNWDIQRHPGWYDLPRGGVLCEQMGTGKTLMCLSLIVATLHQSTQPPTTEIDITPTSTEIAERSYPFTAYSQLRSLTGFPTSRTNFIFPSLVELCANVLSVHDPSSISSPYLPPHLTALLKRNAFYCSLPPPQECVREAKRNAMRRDVKKTYLAKGTLVVVPQILVAQWKGEIEKHVEEGVLNVYEVSGELPPVDKLMEYDVREHRLLCVDMLTSVTGHPHGRCSHKLPPSVLLQARWKRIILDEGHVAHNKTTNAMLFVRQLSIERRWIVSGTPTRHLQQGGEIELEFMDTSSHAPSILTNTQPQSRRAWSKRDMEDATRLGTMIGGFLAAEPFKSEGKFQQLVAAPLRRKEGPDFGAVGRMKYLLGGLLVKHGPKVIDLEAQLPPSTTIKEVIQFDPMQRLTYNVLAALVASNVYTSGGEDADYFLHPRNAESFHQVVTNLHLACFWYSARDMDTFGCLLRTREWLEKHPDRPVHIRERLEEACWHLERAVKEEGWVEWMGNAISMPCDGSLLPSILKEAWSDSFDTKPDMVDIHSLNILRELNVKGANLQGLHMAGWASRVEKCDWFWEVLGKGYTTAQIRELLGDKAPKAARPKKEKTKEDAKKSVTATTTAAQAPREAPKSPSKPRRGKKSDGDEIDSRLDEAGKNARLAEALNDNRPTPLPFSIQTKTKSAKVNFVLRTILAAPEEDKFVIFGSTYELGHLTEGLDMCDVTTCFVGHTLDAKHRRQALDRFESPEVKVCLLDLRLAARGLNLVVANRMIFLAPIWSPDIQAQAIKRVHRIGQTRPTTVQILITEGTFEEDIANRAKSSRSDDEEKMYSRAMIENPRFAYAEKEEEESFEVRFCPKRDWALNREKREKREGPASPPPPAKRRRVMFASPTPLPELPTNGHVKSEALKREAEDRPGEPKKKARISFA
ncbi:hypothetical protein I350_01731 [Cryptococcus amylolentus CBS 6273]|uniref:Helicase C-terminal domain-containing protein n=1 Tax=Cryptococcus amylolentus CBS 6273 TaxID=1296118 RepID=A0A1E3KDF1_9TREE|nr:hypothetical protein I350_01731 [Cryptococcus amylolentus CBS 6273]